MTTPETTAPEFSRLVDPRHADGRRVVLEPTDRERAALARRFGLVAIERLAAEALLTGRGAVIEVQGTLRADIVQSCAVSAEDLAVAIEEPLTFRFVPARADHPPDEEIELDAEACDEIEYAGTSFDLGEAIAQSLGLAIDPFAIGPAAEEARRAGWLGESGEGPFAVLAKLRKD
ncbi:MAG: DUF177 domain-containing protein [Novosphingobium sp.]